MRLKCNSDPFSCLCNHHVCSVTTAGGLLLLHQVCVSVCVVVCACVCLSVRACVYVCKYMCICPGCMCLWRINITYLNSFFWADQSRWCVESSTLSICRARPQSQRRFDRVTKHFTPDERRQMYCDSQESVWVPGNTQYTGGTA